jgi:hypothetical protein
MTYNLNELRQNLEQLRTLSERLAIKENNWSLIQQNKSLIKDALIFHLNRSSEFFSRHFANYDDVIRYQSQNYEQRINISLLSKPTTPEESRPGISTE